MKVVLVKIIDGALIGVAIPDGVKLRVIDTDWYEPVTREYTADCLEGKVIRPLYADQETKDRLEYLRGELRAECISYGELAELQELAEYIDDGDIELLEAAGVPEFPEEEDDEAIKYG